MINIMINKGVAMKKTISLLFLAVLLQGSLAWAQLAPVNEMGLSWGHMHLYPPDREKEAKAWIRMGGQLLNNFFRQYSDRIPRDYYSGWG